MSDVPPPYDYSSFRIGRGHSHLVKRSDLDAAFAGDLGVTIVAVTRWHSQWIEREPEQYFDRTGWRGTRPAVDPRGWMPLCSVVWQPRRARPGAWLSCYSVPSQRRAELRAVMTGTILPDVVAWTRDIAGGAETRKDLGPKLLWFMRAGAPARAEC
jgi:hypothetical protein